MIETVRVSFKNR